MLGHLLITQILHYSIITIDQGEGVSSSLSHIPPGYTPDSEYFHHANPEVLLSRRYQRGAET